MSPALFDFPHFLFYILAPAEVAGDGFELFEGGEMVADLQAAFGVVLSVENDESLLQSVSNLWLRCQHLRIHHEEKPGEIS